MNDYVEVMIPVSPEVALLLQDSDRAKQMGRLVSDLLRPSTPKGDPLAALIATIKIDACADSLTDDEIDAELAAYNGENRL